MAGNSASSAAHAQTAEYRSIYVFQGEPDGATPESGLAIDQEGRLYGSTFAGGTTLNEGTVFRLTRPASGSGPWTEEVLHDFTIADGIEPLGTLALDASSSVYGSTFQGGVPSGRGTIFRIDDQPGFPFTILHAFTRKEGVEPMAGVLFGPLGLLYGTTSAQRYVYHPSAGTAFSVSPQGDATEYSILHTFGKTGDGANPSGLLISSSGTEFGATSLGGPLNLGTVYSLRPTPSGKGTEKVLYEFGPAPDVNQPFSAPIGGYGALQGSLFGCGTTGGSHGLGGIYRLTPQGDSTWSESVLYNFGDQVNDPTPGQYQQCYLLQVDAGGKLYGTTSAGGAVQGGAFFELDAPKGSADAWQETVLVNFDPTTPAGGNPFGTPLRVGDLYYGSMLHARGGYGGIYELKAQ